MSPAFLQIMKQKLHWSTLHTGALFISWPKARPFKLGSFLLSRRADNNQQQSVCPLDRETSNLHCRMADNTTTTFSHCKESPLDTNVTVTRHEKKKKSTLVYVSTDVSTSILLSHFRQKLAWLPLLAKSFQTQISVQCRPMQALKHLCR